MKKRNDTRNEFYVRAMFSLAKEQRRVLKHGDMFAIFNEDGNIRPFKMENHGIYFDGTRFLSYFIINIENKYPPLLLSSTVKEENEVMVVDFTNPDIVSDGQEIIPKEQVHFFRLCFVKDQCYYERINVSNYGLTDVKFTFSIEFDADFRDMFEVRGLHRKKRGKIHESVLQDNSVQFIYEGLDKIKRKTTLSFTPKPSGISEHKVDFDIFLKKNQQKNFYLRIDCESDKPKPPVHDNKTSLKELRNYYRRLRKDRCRIETSDTQFNNWLDRSSDDLFMMLTETEDGVYPYAGIPWFSTAFGRDGIITALETLWIYPKIARGVLYYLSKHQATEFIPESDAEPGKIFHEVRTGEMANLNEIPFKKYYGSIDSTPLYLILAGHYYQRSGDLDFIKKLWPSFMSALNWINQYGDRDGDGFVEYEKKAIGGLTQQGWKDSQDSVFHKDGKIAEPPIALCEVQGYVYEAKMQMACLARALEEYKLWRTLCAEADELKKKFQSSFWCTDMNMPAIALDGKKRPCRVLSSNGGQCLFSGIVSEKMAAKIRGHLMSSHFLSGWGIRTLADSEIRYNPMSYHNGSIWPHDNALIAYGLSRYGYKDSAIKIMSGLFDASFFMEFHRLPELFCGFERRPGEGPTLYPVACNPQAWASAAVFMLIQACLGMSINATEGRVYFTNPMLPSYLENIQIRNLAVGTAKVDMDLKYNPDNVAINIVRRKGKVEVVSIK